MSLKDNNENYSNIIFPEKLKKNLDEIKELYQNIHQYCFKYFIFPDEDYKDIIERYETINNNINPENSNRLEEYKSLSKPILEFSEKIKKSYENDALNDIFEKLKELNNKLINYKNIIDGEIINNSKSVEQTPGIELIENEQEKFKIDEYSSYNRQIDSFSNKKIIEDKKFQISLTCLICSNEAEYICYNHCCDYFCNSCISKNDPNNKRHNFTKIIKKKEKEKLECVNSIFHIVKNNVELADKIFKLNKDNIEYPVLKNGDEIDSQKKFLSDINDLFNIDYNSSDLSIKPTICPPLKNLLKEMFGLKESLTGFKPNENDFLSLAEDISIFADNNEQKKGVKCVNKIKDAIDHLGNKYVTEENVNVVQNEFKNLIRCSDKSKIFKSLHKTANEIKNNKDFQEIKNDIKNIKNSFHLLFKK